MTVLAPPSRPRVSRQALRAFLDQRGDLRGLLERRTGVRELLVLTGLYVAYSATRLVADDALTPARERALALLDVERFTGLAWERSLNRLFVEVDAIGLVASYWYATAHYVVTAAVLVWLHRRGPAAYLPARRTLLLATIAGLAIYLLLPMAPPRLVPGYVDVLSLHSADGWWGSEASAPKGLGGFTNQLAAFPSLHAGWALWIAIVVHRSTPHRGWRGLGWTYAIGTALVVVGTGNHWVLDAVAGWLVVVAAFAALDRHTQGWRPLSLTRLRGRAPGFTGARLVAPTRPRRLEESPCVPDPPPRPQSPPSSACPSD